MNIYVKLNRVIEYVEENLEDKIELTAISKMLGMNEYTFQKIFAVVADISFSEYIRNRRLSNAGQEIFLKKDRVVDIAIKYGYNNATSFSRAFERFHGMKPSEVKKKPEKLRMYTKLHFNEQYECNKNIDYQIVEKQEMTLFGDYILTDNKRIIKEAPSFFDENTDKYGFPLYAMTEYDDKERMKLKAYWVLYKEKIEGMQERKIPKSKWIQIRVNSQETKDIQEATLMFYKDFLPNSKYNYRDFPEMEFYHDGITDFLVPIED